MRTSLGLSLVLFCCAALAGPSTAHAEPQKAWRLIECKSSKCLDAQKKIHGRVLLRWPDGSKRLEGEFRLGKRHGVWTTYWPNGNKLAELSYAAGVLTGPAKLWYEDGKQRAAGVFAQGKKAGLWSIWGTEGTAVVKVTLGGAGPSFSKETSANARNVAKAALSFELGSTDQSQLKSRAATWAKAADGLRKLADQPAPVGLGKQERTTYDQQSSWLRSAADRLSLAAGTATLITQASAPATAKLKLAGFASGKSLSAAYDGIDGEAFDGLDGEAFGGAMGGAGLAMVGEMAAMNAQMLALQNAIQQESRKFQTLSNATKARHDVALNSIRNLKG